MSDAYDAVEAVYAALVAHPGCRVHEVAHAAKMSQGTVTQALITLYWARRAEPRGSEWWNSLWFPIRVQPERS